MTRPVLVLLGILFAAGFARAQTTTIATPLPIERDPQAVTLANQSLQAMAGVAALQDATVQATATWVAGSDEETGSATLEAKGSQESRMTLYLSQGQRQEVRSSPLAVVASAPSPPGAWAGPDGSWHALALHNCWTDASWFFPAFTLQTALNDPTVSLIYIGPDSLDSAPAIHLVLYHNVLSQQAGASTVMQRLSTMHVYLDTTSLLPVGMVFNTHPDHDAGLNIPVEVHFSDYKAISGVQVPMHIQKFLQGSLLLDLWVTGAQINSGLTDSAFTVPATTSTDSISGSGGAR
jgi:hypothetical protein